MASLFYKLKFICLQHINIKKLLIMKKKLFYLFIAVFLFSISGKTQTNAKTIAYTVISLIGPGSPSGSWSIDTDLSTTDGETYTGVDLQLRVGAMQFRSDNGWDGIEYTPTVAGTGFPSGSGVSTGINSPAIPSPGGVWTVTFTKSKGSWVFTAGTPNTVVQLTGTAVTGTPVTMSTNNGVQYTLSKVTLKTGNCQFYIDENGATTTGSVGGTTFPTGTAISATDIIPISLSSSTLYDVTFDLSTGAYTFAPATFPQIAIVGPGAGGWPPYPQPVGYTDPSASVMTTTDGVTYTLTYISLTDGAVQFRQDNAWDFGWGGDTFPSGTKTTAGIPAVAGYYKVTFNITTGAYSFVPYIIYVVGYGVGGFANNYTHPMSTVDGVNFTLNNLVISTYSPAIGIKFKENTTYPKTWGGGDTWPSGTKGTNNIPGAIGTYNVSINRVTGDYSFTTVLGVNKFDTVSFKTYPNPTKSSWNITSNDDITSVQVYNILGKSVYTKYGSLKEVTVNAAELSKGVYFAKVSTVNGTSTVKLVKE